jgi:hypothetical protein
MTTAEVSASASVDSRRRRLTAFDPFGSSSLIADLAPVRHHDDDDDDDDARCKQAS